MCSPDDMNDHPPIWPTSSNASTPTSNNTITFANVVLRKSHSTSSADTGTSNTKLLNLIHSSIGSNCSSSSSNNCTNDSNNESNEQRKSTQDHLLASPESVHL